MESSVTDRLLKVLVLSKLHTRASLVQKYQSSLNQLNLFSSVQGFDINTFYSDLTRDADLSSALSDAHSTLSLHLEAGIRIIDYFSEEYPPRLRSISDPPLLLFVKGKHDILTGKSVAIVGTRRASQYGLKASFGIARMLASNGINVVSGLALGIDAAAHGGALGASGPTTAILAGSVDRVYPKENKPLAAQILAKKGALLSEHPLGSVIFKGDFVQRNRIQSGMSICSVIVESSPESGSARQAEFSFKQNRKIFVIFPEKIDMNTSDFKFSGADYLQRTFNAELVHYEKDAQVILDYVESFSQSHQ